MSAAKKGPDATVTRSEAMAALDESGMEVLDAIIRIRAMSVDVRMEYMRKLEGALRPSPSPGAELVLSQLRSVFQLVH